MSEEMLKHMKLDLFKSKSVFLTALALGLNHVITERVPTAGTDGVSVFYNPNFLATLTRPQRFSLLLHEVWHVALDHPGRIGSRIHKKFNRAGDYVINLLVAADGYAHIPDWLLDSKYTGMSTEQVYEIIKDEKSFPKSPQDTGLDVFPTGSMTEGSDGKPMAIGKAKDIVTQNMARAMTQQRMSAEVGTLPGELREMFDKLLNPKLTCWNILQKYMNEAFNDEYSWKRPNKRYFDQGLYLPTMRSEGMDNLTIAIDTSGSISREDLLKILTEIQHILSTINYKTVTLLDCDRDIHNVYKLSKAEEPNIRTLEFGGGGGTSFRPVFEYCEKHPTKVLLYFTDLYATPIQKKPKHDVVWLCWSDHEPAKIGRTIYYDNYE